jgi:hypothetical protein
LDWTIFTFASHCLAGLLQFVFEIENFILLTGQEQYYLRQNSWCPVEAAHNYGVASSVNDVSVFVGLN